MLDEGLIPYPDITFCRSPGFNIFAEETQLSPDGNFVYHNESFISEKGGFENYFSKRFFGKIDNILDSFYLDLKNGMAQLENSERVNLNEAPFRRVLTDDSYFGFCYTVNLSKTNHES